MIVNPKPPAPRRAPWLVAGAVALLILGLPASVLIGHALAAAIAAYGAVVAPVLLGAGALLLVGVVRIVFAVARRLEAQAKQLEIVQLQNGQPIHLLDVSILAQRYAARTLDRHYDVEQARAEHSQYPGLTSIHQAIHHAPAPSPPAALLPGPDTPAALPSLREAIDRGWSSPDRWLVGLAGALPQQIALPHAGFIAVSGVQGTGKTNTAALLAAQCAAHGGYVFVGDPHAGDAESLSHRIAPLGSAVQRWASTPDDINAMIGLVDRIYGQRARDPGQITGPILLILDEFMALMVRQQLSDAAIQTLLVLSGEGRKKQVFVALVAQNWSQTLLGANGVAIRQNVTHALVHRCGAQTAEFLLPGGSWARQAATLSPGQLVCFGDGEPAITAVPRLSDADLAFAARGRGPTPPPRSPVAAPATIAPTDRVSPRAAPPTAPIAPPTVQEQIVELLRRQAWRTSTEIAQALQIDVKVVRTVLTPLERARAIVRRPSTRDGREKFEYALHPSINHPSGLTLSA